MLSTEANQASDFLDFLDIIFSYLKVNYKLTKTVMEETFLRSTKIICQKPETMNLRPF